METILTTGAAATMTATARPKVTNGMLLFAIAIVHNLVGLAAGLGVPAVLPESMRGRRLFSEIAAAGLVGGVEPDAWRMLLFWFLFFGFVTMILGWFIHTVERAGHRPSRAVAWQLGALALAGGLLIPASGFWLVLLVAWRMGRARVPVPS